MSNNAKRRAKNTALVITGAIDIRHNQVPFTRITDTQTRLDQYLDSIGYAIRNYRSIDKIVFVENSLFSHDYTILGQLAARYRKELEVLSFRGDIAQTSLHGKGFGEMESINYALDNSRLLFKSDAFIKLTGRVRILNFDCVMRSAYGANSFYAIANGQFPYVETIFYRVEKSFFQQHLADIGHLVFDDKKMYLERVAYQRLLELAKHHQVGSFRAYRFIEGVSASTGNPYATKLPYKISNSLHAFLRRFDINRQ